MFTHPTAGRLELVLIDLGSPVKINGSSGKKTPKKARVWKAVLYYCISGLLYVFFLNCVPFKYQIFHF